MNSTTKQMTFGIMLALSLWGVYLAIGATGMFIQEGMLDPRKSLIVIVCVGLFIGLWAIVLFGSSRKSVSRDSPHSATRSWSVAGLTAVALGLLGVASWIVAAVTWKDISLSGTTVLGWISAGCILGSATAGMIALSSRKKLRGRWLGALGLAGCVVGVIAFVARMTP